MEEITNDEWKNIHANFKSSLLLTAVDHIDAARHHFGDGDNWEPPQIRTDLLKLHEMAIDVINYSNTDNIQEMFDMAIDLEIKVDAIIPSLEVVLGTLGKLNDLYPKTLND